MPVHASRRAGALSILVALTLTGCSTASGTSTVPTTPRATPAVATTTPTATPPVTGPAVTAAPTRSTTTKPAKPSPTGTGTPRRPKSTPKPAAAGYSTNHNQDGTTTRWNPCQPLTYRINLTFAPSGAVTDIKAALVKVSAVTGLRFTYAGTTKAIPTSSTLTDPGTPDLTFAWAKPGTSDLLDNATESARGGWQSAPTLDPATGLISWRIVRGYVLLDTIDAPTWKPGFGTGRRRGTLLMHEIGHVVGLNHTSTPGQIMNGQITKTSTSTWGNGDLRGLRTVGATNGCLP